MQGMETDIESLRTTVSRHFTVQKIVVNPFAVTFTVAVDPAELDARFEGLRKELVPAYFVPTIIEEGGAVLVHVQKRPEPKFRGTHVNLILLIATIGTTWIAGAVNWELYADVPFLSWEALVYGFVSFTVPLLAILGAHEMGHYLVAKRHGVRASLPFFIPSVPTVLGTFGAFISMRDPIPNRRALLEIGLAGPLVGFAIAIPVTLLGLFLNAGDTRPPVLNGSGEITMPSLLYAWMQSLFPADVVDPFRRHPTAFAGWVGLFVTSINLLPAGQLDGGHVARALFGDRHRYLSWGAVLLLFTLGAMSYTGWFLFALIILLLGVRHPPPLNDITKLSPSRRALGILGIVILIVTFVPAPFIAVPTEASFSFESAAVPGMPISELNGTIAAGTSQAISLVLNNTGTMGLATKVEIFPQNLLLFGWTLEIRNYTLYGDGSARTVFVNDTSTTVILNVSERATFRVLVGVPPPATAGRYSFAVWGRVVEPDRGVQEPFKQVTAWITVP